MNQIIHSDCDEWLKSETSQCIIADPPDGLGLSYDGYDDKFRENYYDWLVDLMIKSAVTATHSWWLYYYKHDFEIKHRLWPWIKAQGYNWRMYYWTFGFGQNQRVDCTNGHRPILRLSKPGSLLFPDRVQSDRATIYGDKRAASGGKTPDDVWHFSRITGNHSERRDWHPTQIPEGVYTRMIRMSTQPGDTVVDLFGGTGTLFRAGRHLPDRRYIVVEQSKFYCHKIAEEHKCEITTDFNIKRRSKC